MQLERFQLILLRRPASPPDYDEAETARIQREHLAFYAGLRGIAIFAAGSVATVGE